MCVGEDLASLSASWTEAGRWALDHLPGEVGGPVYFCSSGVYVNGKRMGLQTAHDPSPGLLGTLC